jgi:hypothetical protein
MHGGLKVYHLGYYINAYAGWYHIRSFETPVDLVRWLVANGDSVERVDFIAYRVD